ncbi:hypothetical protein FW774_04295 (plasmid) [Pedobacter sp. BS3]|uniref:alginate lyase family protein n=1 Tax=Pedobacter sp. BS3 TaxID=2567937 RepID=UPI0011ECD57F|nr:alginate lyase family protein [Pedobacter sp. BS3]TZF86275.1 hypothetical protein FW774_04295 [Pedobacter sp. BS3]
MKKHLFFLFALWSIGQSKAQVMFSQDFSTSSLLADYINPANPSAGQFNAAGVMTGSSGSDGVTVTVVNNALHVERTISGAANGTGFFARTSNLNPASQCIAVRFKLSVSNISSTGSSQAQFFFGSGFSADGTQEDNTNINSKFGISLVGSAGDYHYALRDVSTGTNSTYNYSGEHLVTWFINASGADCQYTGPDGNKYTLANGKWNIWVDDVKQFSTDRNATTATISLSNFKFIATGGTPTYDMDNLMVVSLANFTHPGISVSKEQLDEIAMQANAGNRYRLAGYQKVEEFIAANPVPTSFPSVVYAKGAGGTPTEDQIRTDAILAYAWALRWARTGLTADADSAIYILNGWASNFDRYEVVSGTSEAQKWLEASWVAPSFAAAAEILKNYTVNSNGSGWQSTAITACSAFLTRLDTTYISKMVEAVDANEPLRLNNQGVSAGYAKMAIGIFQDNAVEYAEGKRIIQRLLPEIIDGSTGEVFELCSRDCTHPQYSMCGFTYAAEMARIQTDSSLYEANAQRLRKGWNWIAKAFAGQIGCRDCSTANNVIQPAIETAYRYYQTDSLASFRNKQSPYGVKSDNTFLGFTTYTNLQLTTELDSAGVWNYPVTTWSYDLSSGGSLGTTYHSTSASNSVSSGSSVGFLPSPPSGSARVAQGSTGNGGYELLNLGTSDAALKITANSAALNKFSVYDITEAGPAAAFSFKIIFGTGGTNGEYAFSVGNGTGGVFTSGSQVSTSTVNSSIFSSLRWIYSDSGIRLCYRSVSDGVISYTTIANFVKGNEYDIELYLNNDTVGKEYIRGSVGYTVPPQRYQFWVNGLRMSDLGNYNFPYSQQTELDSDKALNAFLITSTGNTSPSANSATLTLSHINMTFPNLTLPVSLKAFNADYQSGRIQLNWTTVSEYNTMQFDILRSADGKTFSLLGAVQGNGTSKSTRGYSYIDYQPLANTGYYQLRQVDFNGSSNLLGTLSVRSLSPRASLSFYKAGDLSLYARIYAVKTGMGKLVINDLSGRVIFSHSIMLNQGSQDIQIPSSTLLPGIYVGKLDMQPGIVTSKFIF